MIRFKHIPFDRNTTPAELAIEIKGEAQFCQSLDLDGYYMPQGVLLYTHANDIKNNKYTGIYIGGVPGQVIAAYVMVDGAVQNNIFGVDYEGDAYINAADVANGFVFGFKYSGGGTGCPDWYCGIGTNLDSGEGCGFYCHKNSFYWCHGDSGAYVYDVSDNGRAIVPNDNKWLSASPVISAKGRVIADNIFAINTYPVVSEVDIWNESDDVEEWKTFSISDTQGSYISGRRTIEESTPQFMMRV